MQSPFQRLLTRAQFQAVLAGQTVAKSPHFSLHRQSLAMSLADRLLHAGAAVKPDAGLDVPVCAVQGNAAAVPSGLVPAHAVVASTPTRPLFPQSGPWLGAMVPKRWAKRAVTRNTIKRQIYAVSADFSPRDAEAAFVVRLRRDFSRQEFRSASSDLLRQAVRAELQMLFQIGERHA